jgi:hypothetical protein
MFGRRIDTPGHDACRLEQENSGWSLEGAAVFRHGNGPAHIEYSVRCDAVWQTISGRIRGFVAERTVDFTVVRADTSWILNGASVPGLDHLVDLDLGFTPATNMQQLRRVSIAENETVQLPVTWFDLDAGTLIELPQIYQRSGRYAFWYQAPTVGYEGWLKLDPNGFISSYPGFWEAEANTPA